MLSGPQVALIHWLRMGGVVDFFTDIMYSLSLSSPPPPSRKLKMLRLGLPQYCP